MKILIDISSYQPFSIAQWDLLATVVDGVIIRLCYGTTTDALAAGHVAQCKRLNLPFAGYAWIDPTSDMVKQQNKYLEVINLFNPASMFNDYEQYWTDWDAYMRQDLAEAYRTRFTPSYLDNYYHNFNNFSMSNCKIPIGQYSADWFIEKYSPASYAWIKNGYYWDADYLKYTDASYMALKEKEWGVPYDISRVKEVAAYAFQTHEGIIRQFDTFMKIKGMEGNIGYHLDWDVSTDEGYTAMFKGGKVGKILNIPFVSQLGEGAEMHNNDCGPACCSMWTVALKDIVVPVNEWYAMEGWGAPSTDVGTTAYQLQKAVGLFDITSTAGSGLTIEAIHGFIDKGFPITCLVDYKVFSDAGITVNKGGFLHWLVIQGYDEKNIITLDPYRPYENSGTMVVSNELFIQAYRNSYLVSTISTEGGVIPMTTNGITTASLNVRDKPPVNGVLGNWLVTLPNNTRVYIERSTITKDNWGNVTYPATGWVSMAYVTMDAVVVPPGVDEKAIRTDELNKMEAYIANRKTQL